jgi:CheY-like chemotaxis protein
MLRADRAMTLSESLDLSTGPIDRPLGGEGASGPDDRPIDPADHPADDPAGGPPDDPEADATGVGVLCVDDNVQVAEALQVSLFLAGGFIWKGWLPSADGLVETVERERPDILILDVDMPGRHPFDALRELVERCPDVRTVMFSGHVRRELIEQAFDAGAWGYVSKSDGEQSLLRAVRQIAAGELALSPEARAAYDWGDLV